MVVRLLHLSVEVGLNSLDLFLFGLIDDMHVSVICFLQVSAFLAVSVLVFNQSLLNRFNLVSDLIMETLDGLLILSHLLSIVMLSRFCFNSVTISHTDNFLLLC
jgi:hypothetical protein